MKYHYVECGLTNVFIEGLVPMEDDDGDLVIQIPAINVLHGTIALGIVSHKKSISGAELRFLRTEMGLTQSELAGILQVDKQTVGRWEREETPLDGAPEAVIRQLAVEKLLLPFSEGIEALARASVDSAEPQTIDILHDAETSAYKLAA